MDTFNAVKSHARDMPIIILSGMDDETLALNAVHAGAEDYLVKGRVDSQLITRAIVYAMERTEAKKAVIKAEEKFRSIFRKFGFRHFSNHAGRTLFECQSRPGPHLWLQRRRRN